MKLSGIADYIHLAQEYVHAGILWRRRWSKKLDRWGDNTENDLEGVLCD
jgi:hypothetical protein